jgi:hypothetical protein
MKKAIMIFMILGTLIISCKKQEEEKRSSVSEKTEPATEVMASITTVPVNEPAKQNDNMEKKKEKNVTKGRKISNYEKNLKSRMKKIEEKYQDLIDNGTTDSMLSDTESLTDEWDRELNIVYNLVLDQLNSSEKEKVRVQQRQWLKSRDAKVKKAENDEEDPKMALFDAAGTKLEMTKERTLKLAEMFDELNER